MDSGPIHLINIVPLSEGINETDTVHLPFGILYVGSALKRAGFDVVLHHITANEIDETAQGISAADPLFVGFSVLSGLTTHYSAVMSEKIKQLSAAPVMWGGHHPSLMAAQCLSEGYIDIVCIGEGENTAVELAKALRDGKPLSGVCGIGYKDGGCPVINEPRAWIEDLDELQLDWELLDLERYFPIVRDWYTLPPDLDARVGGKRFITLFSSRGCPFNCGFCSSKKYYGRLWRPHSVDYILRQVDQLEKLIGPVGMVGFSDDNVMVNKKRGTAILDSLYQRDVIADYINIRVDQLSDDVVEVFDKYDVHSLFFGFESGTERVLKLMGKNITPEQILARVEALRKYPHITVTASGILGAPTETEADVRNTIDFALELHRMLPNGAVSLFRFMALPGTDLTELAVRNGFKLPERTADWRIVDPQYDGYRMDWLPWMTPRKLRNLCHCQTLIRNCMSGVSPDASLRLRLYHGLITGINRWRLRHQVFIGLEAQQRMERAIKWLRALPASLR